MNNQSNLDSPQHFQQKADLEIQSIVKHPAFQLTDDAVNFSIQLANNPHNKYLTKSSHPKNILNLSSRKSYEKRNPDGQQNRYSKATDLTNHGSTEFFSMHKMSSQSMRSNIKNLDLYNYGSSQGLRDKVAKRPIFTMRNKRLSVNAATGENKEGNFSIDLCKLEKKQIEKIAESAENKNSCEALEKKYNRKKGIMPKAITEWLNEALIEATPGINVDKNVEGSAITYYCIDRSSLISKSLSPDNIDRLYQSLFVYSIGFNTLLKQFCGSKKELIKSIWRVYAILLEYCSGGSFQTMIGEMERDKSQKIAQYKSEIEKRQKIIEYNEEINEEKNAKIFKDLKELTDKVKNLEEEKEILLQDFHEAEQSFNQEILLRLKYENRINEIHGVYEEIRSKNESLREAHAKLSENLIKEKQKTSNQSQQIAALTIQLEQMTAEKHLIESNNKLLADEVHSFEKNLRITNNNYLTIKNKNENGINVISELNRKIEQLNTNLKSSEFSEESTLKSFKVTTTEYERSLRENVELHQTIKIQMEKISDLMEEIRQFNNKSSDLHAEIKMYKHKIEDQQDSIKELKEEEKKARSQVQQIELQLLASNQNRQSLKADLENCHKNITEMSEKQNNLEANYSKVVKENQKLQQLIEERLQETKKLKQQIQQKNDQIYKLQKQLKIKQSEMSIITQKLTSQIEIAKTKYNKLMKQLENMTDKCAKYQSERSGLFQQIDDNKARYEEIFVKFKNEKFERDNIELRYKQSLTVMEEENDHIKKLNIHISQLNEDIDDLNRKLVNNRFVHQEEAKQLAHEIGFWKLKYSNKEEQFSQRGTYIHPSKYEDLYAHVVRLQEKYDQVNKKLKNSMINREDSVATEKRFKLTKESLSQQYQQKQAGLQRQLKKKQDELEFMNQKNSYMKKKLQDMEKDLDKLKNETEEMVDGYREREKANQDKIKDRNLHIQELNKKIEGLIKENTRIVSQKPKRVDQKKEQSPKKTGGKQKPTCSNHQQQKSFERDRQENQQRNNQSGESQIKTEENEEYIESKYKQGALGGKTSKDLNNQENLQKGQYEQYQESKGSYSPKKRENIKKKLKGAYLYYHK